MLPPQIQDVIERLYSGVNPYRLSREARNRRGREDESFRYGEIDAVALCEVMDSLPPDANEVFYDLGSGTGRAVFAAALTGRFRRVIGVELLADLHDAAGRALARFDSDVRPQLPVEMRTVTIEFVRADLGTFNYSDADVIFTHCTCFTPALMAQLAAGIERVRVGARVITASKLLSSSSLKMIGTQSGKMDWGVTPLIIYVKER